MVQGELCLAEPCFTITGNRGEIGAGRFIRCRMNQGCAWLLAQLLLLSQENSLPINKPPHLVNIAQHTSCAGLNARTDASASWCVLLKTLSHGGRILESLKSNFLKEKITH